MNDHEACYGEFRAIICEWRDKDDNHCHSSAEHGKSYCEKHHNNAYRIITSDLYEKEVDKEINDIETQIERHTLKQDTTNA